MLEPMLRPIPGPAVGPMLALILLILGLAGCGGHPAPGPLRVGSNVWPGYEPLYLARTTGGLDPEQVHLVELPSATAVMHQMLAGNLEGACLTLDEALLLRAQGEDLRVVAVMDFSDGADALLARPSVPTLAALRGKRIGVEHTAVGAVLLDGALEAAGLEPGEVELVHLPVDEHEAAFLAGRVDAVVTFEPVRSRLLAQGARVLFDSGRLPGRIMDVLVLRAAALAARPEAARALVAGYFRGLAFLREHPREAARIMARRLGVPPERVQGLFAGLKLTGLADNRLQLLGHPAPLQVTAEGLARLMRRHELLERLPPLEGLVDGRLLPLPAAG